MTAEIDPFARKEGETMTAYRARITAAVRAAAPPVKWKHLGVRVTVEEHDQIAAAAKARGVTVSDFVRQIAREVAAR